MLQYGTMQGSNSRHLDLQSDSYLLPDTLQTALRGLVNEHYFNDGFKFEFSNKCAFDKLKKMQIFGLWPFTDDLGRNTRKPVFRGLRTTKSQTSLRIRTV